MSKDEGGPDSTQRYVDALKHPLRRAILHLAIESREEISPVRASRALDKHLSNVTYHVKLLASHGLLTPSHTGTKRGAVEHFYAVQPAALEHPVVKAFLGQCDS